MTMRSLSVWQRFSWRNGGDEIETNFNRLALLRARRDGWCDPPRTRLTALGAPKPMRQTVAHQRGNESLSLAASLAQFFRSRPGIWIDGRELARIAGSYAWRTRTSDIRRKPFNMRIDNRQRKVEVRDGQVITVSEYRYVPPAPANGRQLELLETT